MTSILTSSTSPPETQRSRDNHPVNIKRFLQNLYFSMSHPTTCMQVSSPHTFFPPYERASPRHHGNSPLHRAPLLRGSPWSSPHPSVGSSPHPIGSSPHPGADPKTAVHNFSPGPEHAALELRSQLYRAALLQTSSPFGPPPFPFPSTAYFPRPAFHPSLDSLPVSISSSSFLSIPVSSSG